MDKFFIISNYGKTGSRQLANRVRDYLATRGCRCRMDTGIYEEEPREHSWYRYTNPDRVPGDTQCVLVIGGDGTMLQAARDLKCREIPILGINQGTLGYLAEIDPDSIEYALECLIRDRYTVEKRMLLHGRIQSHSMDLISDYALNDIVLSRSCGLDVNDYNIYVDGELLNKYVADGMIIATPTGSTAYNLSAGGPIVDPKAFNMVLTPISPHSLHSRSIVLRADSHILVEVSKRPDKRFVPVQVCFDGNVIGLLQAGDRIEIEQAKTTVSILKVSNVSFLETLRRKMSDR